MANWDREKPKGMAREELEKRVAAGLVRWKARGWIPQDFNQTKGRILAAADGPSLGKFERRRVMQAAELAIYSLANKERQDYLHAVDVIRATARVGGMEVARFMTTICDGIADAASAASGEPRYMVDQLARTWLSEHYTTGIKLISIPSMGANDDGESKEDTPAATGPTGQPEPAADQDHRDELQPGETRGRAEGAGGSEPAGVAREG